MMNDCQDVTMREALPELVHGLLADAQRAAVEEHLRDCVDCTQELAILRAVLASSHTPRVDTVRIASAIPAYHPMPMTDALVTDGPIAVPEATVTPIGAQRARRWRADTPQLRLAAAVVIAAIGISTVTLVARQHGASSADVPAASRSVASNSAAGVALVGTADLSDAELASLIQDLNSVQALPPADPEPMSPATDGGV